LLEGTPQPDGTMTYKKAPTSKSFNKLMKRNPVYFHLHNGQVRHVPD